MQLKTVKEVASNLDYIISNPEQGSGDTRQDVIKYLTQDRADIRAVLREGVMGMKNNDLKDTITHRTLHRPGSMHERYIETGKLESECNHYNQALDDILTLIDTLLPGDVSK